MVEYVKSLRKGIRGDLSQVDNLLIYYLIQQTYRDSESRCQGTTLCAKDVTAGKKTFSGLMLLTV